jgi:copper chaperone CopZ
MLAADERTNAMAVTTEYRVTGMSCGHCEASVRSEVAKLQNIEQITVSAADGTLVVESLAPLDDAAVIAAVDEAGYEAARA